MGNFPCSDQLQNFSMAALMMMACARVKPFDENGVPQQTSSDVVRYINRNARAAGQIDHHLHQRAIFRLSRQPSHHPRDASWKVNCLGAHLPGLRYLPGGIRSIRHPFAQIVARETLHRPGQRLHAIGPNQFSAMCPSRNAVRNRRSRQAEIFRDANCPFVRAGEARILRKRLTSCPVSMLTGQAVAQRPSVAQVSSAM